MWDHLLIGLFAIATGFGLLMLGSPNHKGENPHLLQGSSSPMLYPPVILVFLVVGIAELMAWVATTQWWLAAPIIAGKCHTIRHPFSTSRAEVSNIWQLTATAGGRA